MVKMTDDNVSPPYKIAPGTRVRLESAYDGSTRRLGVMVRATSVRASRCCSFSLAWHLCDVVVKSVSGAGSSMQQLVSVTCSE